MELTLFDGFTFVAFLAIVVGISLYASRKEDDSGDYFLAGRNLTWGLTNISTEHFVSMADAGFGKPFVNCQQALSKLINSLLLIQVSSILKAGIHHGLLV